MNQRHLQTVYENEEDRQLARILSTLIWATWVMYLVATFTGLYYGDWKLITTTLTGSALLVASMLLLRRGHLRASSLIVVLGALGTVTILATVGQGIRDLALVAIPVIFIFAGLTLNRAFFRLCVGLALAAVCWLALGEIYGWFVPIPFDGEMANWLYLISMIVILLVAALAVDLLAINMRKGLELARQEISQRKNTETRNRIIAEVQDTLLRPCELKDIYRLVSEKVKELIGDGITATSILDEKRRTVRMGSYHGADIPFEKVLSVIGFDPWQKEFSLDDTTEGDLRIYRSGRLGILEGGLYTIMTHLVPKPACMLIEKLLRVQNIYAMGFIHKEEHLGALIILARSDITPHVAAIEQIVNLATIAIERKRAEGLLRERDAQFANITSNVPGMLYQFLMKPDGTFSVPYSSAGVNELFGCSPEEVRDTFDPIIKAIVPADQNKIIQTINESAQNLSQWSCEYRVQLPGKTVKWVYGNSVPEKTADGSIIWSGYNTDITERKRAEDALKDSEEMLQSIFASTPDSITVVDVNGAIKLCNQPAVDVHGYSSVEQLIGKGFIELVAEEDHQRAMEGMMQVMMNGVVKDAPFTGLKENGETFAGELSVSAIKDNTGAISGFVGITKDITERKRAEEKLRYQALLLEKVSDTVVSTDNDFRIVSWNQAAENLYGWRANEVIGRVFGEVAPTEYPETDRMDVMAKFQKEGVWQGEVIQRNKDGTAIHIFSSVTALLDHAGNPTGAIAVNRDITERKRAEEKFAKAFQASPTIVIISRLSDGRLVDVNESFEQIIGYAREEAVEHTIFELGIWVNLAEREHLLPILLANGRLRNEEVHFRTKRGDAITCMYSAELIELDGARCALAVIEDITTRKQAEEALQESEQNLRAIFETMSEGIALNEIIYDENGEMVDYRILNVNKAFYSTADYHGSDVIGNVATKLYGMSAEFIKEFWKQHKEKNSTAYAEMRSPVSNRFFYITTSPFVNDRFVTSFFDITERKQAEDILRESEFQLKFSQRVAHVGHWTWDTLTNQVTWSDEMKRIFGLDPDSFAGDMDKIIAEAIHPDDREKVDRSNASVLTGQKPVPLEYRVIWRDGSVHTVWAEAGEKTFDANGNIIKLSGIIQDITERKQAEDKIRAALEEKETLLREVHHRVKNNLQVIISLIKMRARLTQDARTLQFLTELESQAHTMALVYEQLYQSENLAQVNMAQYLRQLTANVLDTYGRRDSIQFHLDAPLALDVAQATPCGLIVNELFSNILKYAFPRGFKGKPTVSITLRQEDETYHLTVSDNGVGFPPGYDWRAAQSMGLRLVNLWVTHQLGGTLTVSGKPGTTFAIAFDLKD